MAVLLTGGAGYIGLHTAIALTAEGYDVAVLDSFVNSKREMFSRACSIVGKEIPLYIGSTSDSDLLDRIFTEQKIDSVIHLAGLKAVGESVEKPLAYYENNLGGMLTVLRIMEKHGVKILVFSSSATVYGVPATVPVTEDMPIGGCTNPYGRTKLMMEDIIRDVSAADGEFSAVLLRYFNPIGAHESGLIGEDPKGIPNNLMPYITKVAMGELPCLRVFGNDYPTQDGTGVRDYIHVCDLAEGHVAALKYAESHSGAEAFNLGTGKGTSVLELVSAFESVSGVKIPLEFTARRAGDAAESYADPTKAEKILGWYPKRDLEKMCEDAWRWQSEGEKRYK